MAINWTKEWSGSDDGSIVKGIDLQNLQNDLATADLVNAAYMNGANLLTNGSFDTFTASPTPDDWVVAGGGTEAQETSIVQIGTNAYSITSDADGSSSSQAVFATIGANDNTYMRGKTVTLGALIYTAEESNARIRITDGVDTSNSAYHSGTVGWELITVTHTLNAAATSLSVVLLVDGASVEAKFDAVRLNHGARVWQFVHHRSDT